MITTRRGASAFPDHRREVGVKVERFRWPDNAWGIDVALWCWSVWVEVSW